MKAFTDSDVHPGQFPRIYAEVSELIEAPTEWQKLGLQQTASGYGAKLNTGLKIQFNGKARRIYATCYSNAASCWFNYNGGRIYVS